MKMIILEKILRYALAAAVIVYAGDVFFRFFERPAPPLEGQEFLIGLSASGYIWETVGGILLVSGILLAISQRFTGLALVLLAPVIVNILLFHFFLDPSWSNASQGLILAGLALAVGILNRKAFRSLVGL